MVNCSRDAKRQENQHHQGGRDQDRADVASDHPYPFAFSSQSAEQEGEVRPSALRSLTNIAYPRSRGPVHHDSTTSGGWLAPTPTRFTPGAGGARGSKGIGHLQITRPSTLTVLRVCAWRLRVSSCWGGKRRRLASEKGDGRCSRG